MLRRVQPIAAKIEPEQQPAAAAETAAAAPARPSARLAKAETGGDTVGAMRAEIERAFTPAAERPAERPAAATRPSMPQPGVERTFAPKAAPPPRKAYQPRPRPRFTMQRSRLLLLLVAVGAGGLAAYFATQGSTPAPAPTVEVAAAAPEVAPAPKAQILVAKQAIGMGEKLSPTSVEWQDWPENALRPEYITIATTPEAIEEMSGAIARFEFFPGEPIRAQKIALASQGYLSAVLESGMRGVSVPVEAKTASGGFILPNDRVDVILTRVTPASTVITDTILHNVRVLAIDTRLGETGTTGAATDPENPRAEVFVAEAIATLELNEQQAAVIVGASPAGKLALVLRSMTDAREAPASESALLNQSIRLASPFWAK